ncbi:MAG: XkdX family protein [Oscillospiraceae bacterium]|nr:XkdX family protein [Oscillospiraceae bacterium]
MTFEMVKRNYERKLWNKQMVKMAVVKGVITAVQYEEITGEVYIVA